jgi:hypothetical protein
MKYLPYALDYKYDPDYGKLRMLPPFGEKSIMIYPSAQYNTRIITWAKDGSQTQANMFPSALHKAL